MDQLRRRDSLNNVNGQIFVEFNLKSRNWGDHPTILTFDCMCVYIYMQKYIYIYTLRERERQRANYAYICIYIQECVFSNKTADVDVTKNLK
jgi:hypothetical protein